MCIKPGCTIKAAQGITPILKLVNELRGHGQGPVYHGRDHGQDVGSVICKGVGMHPLGCCNLIDHLLISGSEYDFGHWSSYQWPPSIEKSHVTTCRVWNVLESYNLQTRKLTRIVASEGKNSRPRQICHLDRASTRSCPSIHEILCTQ